MRRITVGLAPAELRKSGPSYDLPIAVAILLASGQVEGDFSEVLLLGELGLDGTLRHTQGILPMVARTIADLAEAEPIAPGHLAEAIQYQRRAER